MDRPLRLATLNCLHDLGDAELLQHRVRYDAICRELLALNADVIGLNEVTVTLLKHLLEEEWVRDRYTVSAIPDHGTCSHVSSTVTGGGAFGNLLLSRIAPLSVQYVGQLDGGEGRQSHVMSLCLRGPQSGGRRVHIAVASTHLKAFPWLMEGRRRAQLEHLTSTLTHSGDFDACVVMGDFNFHREAENASIPESWGEVPAVVALGETWDYAKNKMLAHYLPLRNIYNGFGLGAGWGWIGWTSSSNTGMRLDRVLVHGAALLDGCGAAEARLFADQPVHERARARPALPLAGPELRKAHRSLPWQDYLMCSDHFGIFVELPLHL